MVEMMVERVRKPYSTTPNLKAGSHVCSKTGKACNSSENRVHYLLIVNVVANVSDQATSFKSHNDAFVEITKEPCST